jgi:hypothetical protein
MEKQSVSENIEKNRDFCLAFTKEQGFEEIKLSEKYVTEKISGKKISLGLDENIFYHKFIKLFFNP